MKDDFWFFAMLNISFALSLDSIDCSTFPVHTYILTPLDDEWVMVETQDKKKKSIKIFRVDNVSGIKEIV